MTTPTANPVPSTSPLDLLFNAEKLDEVVNTTAPRYIDRFGAERLTVQGAVDTIKAINPRGAWVTATAYASKDLVQVSGTWYVAVEAHTAAATFATDAAKWRVYQGVTVGDLASPNAIALIAGSGQVVHSIAALRTLSKLSPSKDAFVTGYYGSGDGGGGPYYCDLSDVSTADNGGTVIVAADGARWKLISSLSISVKQFGAKGDGVTNDSSAIQSAINEALLVGRKLLCPHGNYLCSLPLIIDLSALTSESALTRMSIEGDGSGNTQIICAHTAQGLVYKGGTGGGLSAYFEMSGIRIQGAGLGTCDGFTIDNCAFATFSDVIVTGFTTGYGVRATDLLSALFSGCEIRGNKYGVFGQRVDQSYPNAITFLSTDIGVNLEFGAYFKQPTSLTFIGGSIQGNGVGGVSGSRFGLKLDDGGGEGAVALDIQGTYFEYNTNDADIFISHTVNNCVYKVGGATFNRIDNVNYVMNNIRMDISGGSAILQTDGCGFKGFNTYAISATRPYVKINASGGVYNFFDTGNLYASSLEIPVIPGPVRNTLAPASSYIRFNGATSATAQKFNATLTKNGTGDYTITYDKPMSAASNTYSFALSLAGFVEIFSESATTVRIVTKNSALAPADFAVVCVTVHGGADIV